MHTMTVQSLFWIKAGLSTAHTRGTITRVEVQFRITFAIVELPVWKSPGVIDKPPYNSSLSIKARMVGKLCNLCDVVSHYACL